MDLLHPIDKAAELAKTLCAKVEELYRCDSGSLECVTQPWMLGTVLEISVPTELWARFTVQKTAHVRGVYEKWHDKDTVHVVVGEDVWNSNRSDRDRFSPVLHMANNDPIDSPKRLQIIRLVRDLGGKARRAFSAEQYCNMQTLVHYLRFGARLSPIDVSIAVGMLGDLSFRGFPECVQLMPEAGTLPAATQKMLQFAQEAINYVKTRALYWQLDELFACSIKLASEDPLSTLSFANRTAAGKSLVIVHFKGPEAVKAIRRRRPSFFIDWQPSLLCQEQVHIVDTPVRDHELCLLLFFPRKPSEEQINQATMELRAELGIERSQVIVTAPTEPVAVYIMQLTNTMSTWFRTDGCLDVQFKDDVLSKQLKAVLQPTSDGESVHTATGCLLKSKVFDKEREAVRVVLFTRQSNEDGDRKIDSIPMQISALLQSPILEGLQKMDTLEAIVEFCSSNKHPWRDRRVLSKLSWKQPTFILTLHPLRLTRRADELHGFLERVTDCGGAWFTQCFPQAETSKPTDWVQVTSANLAALEEDTNLARHLPFQSGFNRHVHVIMGRILDAAKSGQSLYQLEALQRVLRLCIICNGFQKVLVLSRSTPNTEKDQGLSAAMETQQTFLERLLPKGPDVHYYKSRASPSNGQFLDGVEERMQGLASDGASILVITASLNKAVTSFPEYERFKSIFSAGDHGVISFIWDIETEVGVRDALGLSKLVQDHEAIEGWERALGEQRRARDTIITRPIIQPIMWIGPRRGTPIKEISEHVERHICHARKAAKARAEAAYNVGSHIKKEFQETKNIRNLSDAERQA